MPSRGSSRVKPEPPGLALLCSRDAVVIRVVYDGLGLGGQIAPGTALISIFDPGSTRGYRNLLETIQNARGAETRPVNVVANGRTIQLWFTAADLSETLEVVGASTPAVAAQIRQRFPDFGNSPGTHSTSRFVPDRSYHRGQAQETDLVDPPPQPPSGQLAIDRSRLVTRNAEVERSIEEKTQWILSASHDLRNQLNAVQVYCELLSEEDDLRPAQRAMAESIHSCTGSMVHLLSDLEQLARSESGKAWLKPVPTAILPLVEESISLCRPAAESKGTRLNLTSREPVPELNIDPQWIRQAFVNLLENAIKYSLCGATVEMVLDPGESEVLVTVRDDGPGIPPEDLDSLFTPFQKTRARAASHEPGTGLGLAICKRIVEHHGGRIWAQSRVGEGATFYVALAYEPNATPGSSGKGTAII